MSSLYYFDIVHWDHFDTVHWVRGTASEPPVDTCTLPEHMETENQGKLAKSMHSECSRFHPNRFTFGGVIAKCVVS